MKSNSYLLLYFVYNQTIFLMKTLHFLLIQVACKFLKIFLDHSMLLISLPSHFSVSIYESQFKYTPF